MCRNNLLLSPCYMVTIQSITYHKPASLQYATHYGMDCIIDCVMGCVMDCAKISIQHNLQQ